MEGEKPTDSGAGEWVQSPLGPGLKVGVQLCLHCALRKTDAIVHIKDWGQGADGDFTGAKALPSCLVLPLPEFTF